MFDPPSLFLASMLTLAGAMTNPHDTNSNRAVMIVTGSPHRFSNWIPACSDAACRS